MKKVNLLLKSRKELLMKIIESSFEILLAQINHGRIIIENEIDLQLHFSYLLKDMGELHQFSLEDVFTIRLEVPFSSKVPLIKSNSERAKIDIMLSLTDRTGLNNPVKCAIELKYFKAANNREPNSRYDAFADLKNLETYIEEGIVDFGVFLLGTDHEHYVNRPRYSINTADFDMRDGSSYKAKKVLVYNTEKPYGNNIELKNDYDFEWTEIDEKWFLMVEI